MTVKKYALIALALSLSLALSACGQSKDNTATSEQTSTSEAQSASSSDGEVILTDEEITPIDVGSINDEDIYVNETLGIEFQLPANWYYLSVDEMDENDQYQIEQNPTAAEALEYTTNLVYGIDEANQNTNFLQITTESIRDVNDPKEVLTTAKTSLDSLAKELTSSGVQGIEVSDVEEVKFDNHTYYCLKTVAPSATQTAESTSGTTTSEMYITKIDDQTFLKFMFNYGDTAGEEAVKNTLNSIKYTK